MTPVRYEKLGASWDIKAWLTANKMSIKRVAELAGVSDTIIHNWDKRSRSPFSFWKFCHANFRVSPNLGPLPTLSVNVQSYRVTPAMWKGAVLFDQKHAGLKFKVEGESAPHEIAAPGASAVSTAMEGTAAPAPAPTPVQTPATVVEVQGGNTMMLELLRNLANVQVQPPVQQQPAEEGVIDTLVTLLTNMKLQRDGLLQRNYALESQLEQHEAERREIVELRDRNKVLQEELETFRVLADAVTAPGSDTRVLERPTFLQIEKASSVLQSRAPGLVEELKRLPQRA